MCEASLLANPHAHRQAPPLSGYCLMPPILIQHSRFNYYNAKIKL